MAKNPAAVALGRKGGRAYVENTSPAERSEAARRAAEARWAKMNETLTQLERKNARLAAARTKKAKRKK